MVDHQQGFFRRLDGKPGAPQRAKSLRAVDLMGNVPVDINQAGAIALRVDRMAGPDQVMERVGHGAAVRAGS